MNSSVIIVLTIAIILFWISLYNRLVKMRNYYENAFSQIDVQLKRRYDLIPNLVETAKGYLEHEKSTLEAVIKARSAAVSACGAAAKDPSSTHEMTKLTEAEGFLQQSLGKLLAVMEAYPDLKGDQHILDVMEELRTTENKISFARQAFNDAVMRFNVLRETFPINLVAVLFRFRQAIYFELSNPSEREAVKVSFKRD